MISLQGAAVRETVLMHLVHLIEDGKHACLVDAGLDPAILHRLRNLPNRDTKRLASMRVPIQVSIDGDALTQALDSINNVNAQQELFEEFVRRGASIPMLRKLFRVDEELIAFTRMALSTPVSRGRPAMPNDPLVRDAIREAWLATSEMDNPKERYRELANRFPAIRLDTLWTVITTLDALEREERYGAEASR